MGYAAESDAELPRAFDRLVDRKRARFKSETAAGIDQARRAFIGFDADLGLTVGAAFAQMLRVQRRAREAVAGEPFHFGCDQRFGGGLRHRARGAGVFEHARRELRQFVNRKSQSHFRKAL
jgi:hypothetical protein